MTHSDGRRAFLKVLDPVDQLKDLELRLAIYNYECDLLEKCAVRKIRRVVKIIDRGSCDIQGLSGPIHYIMFELAESDLGEHASLAQTMNTIVIRVAESVDLGLICRSL